MTMDSPEYSQESGLHVIECGPDNPVADIIAVHGLAANPVYTWIKKVPDAKSNGVGRLNKNGEREVVWLKHLLPCVVPSARILKFNYDSSWLASSPKEELRSISDRLVRSIANLREIEDTTQRPIIFIGHSFGGIVIEEALLLAYRSEEFRDICLHTSGVVFLGTPFRGSGASSWGVTIAGCAAALGFRSSNRLLKTLEEGSERLDLLLNDFSDVAKRVKMRLVCFYELYETDLGRFGVGIKTMVVDKQSAKIDGYNPISLPLTHADMNKFGSSNDESYKLVSSEVRKLLKSVSDIPKPADPIFTAIPQPCSNHFIVPYEQNQDFIPREVPYTHIITLIKRPLENAVRIALRGPGGTGKTQLALKLAYDSKPTCSVFWLHAATEEHFIKDYRHIASSAGLLVEGKKQSEVCAPVKEWLDSEASGHWLLIIDNADDLLNCFSTMLPRLRGTILFTTRNTGMVKQNLVMPGYEVKLQVMTESESMATFLGLSRISNKAHQQHGNILTLLDTLGHLPLAIAQAAAYIRQRDISVNTYTERLQESDRKQSELPSTPFANHRHCNGESDVPRPVMATLEVTFNFIKSVSAATYKLLQIMSLLDFQGIPWELVDSPRVRSHLGLQDDGDFEDALEPLLSFSLVTTSLEHEQPSYRLHRLVSLWTRMRITASDELVTFTLALVSDNILEPSQEDLKQCEAYLPHAAAIFSYVTTFELETTKINSQYLMGDVYHHLSRLDQVKDLHMACYKFYLAVYGPENTLVHRSMHRLGLVVTSAGLYDEGVNWYWRALAGYKKTLGQDHPSTLDIMNSVASVFLKQGQCDQALEWYFRVLAGYEKTLGKDHSSTLVTLNNMALALNEKGRSERALEYYQFALAGFEKTLGKNHPSTLMTVNNMAIVFRRQLRYDEALQWFERALAGFEKTLGKDHQTSLDAVQNMALIFDTKGRYEEALQCYGRALAGLEGTLGKDHRSTLEIINNMALVYTNQGRYEGALQLYARALTGFEDTLGKDHPPTLNVVNNMAMIFYKQGRYNEALQCYERSLAGFEKTLGKDHTSTLDTAYNLALVYTKQGRYDEALQWYQGALAGFQKTHGKDHASTFDMTYNLALGFESEGQYDEALSLFCRSYEGYKKVYGPDHQKTVDVMGRVNRLTNLRKGTEQSISNATGSNVRSPPGGITEQINGGGNGETPGRIKDKENEEITERINVEGNEEPAERIKDEGNTETQVQLPDASFAQQVATVPHPLNTQIRKRRDRFMLWKREWWAYKQHANSDRTHTFSWPKPIFWGCCRVTKEDR